LKKKQIKKISLRRYCKIFDLLPVVTSIFSLGIFHSLGVSKKLYYDCGFTRKMYKQFGNSACVNVIEAVAKHVILAMRENHRNRDNVGIYQISQAGIELTKIYICPYHRKDSKLTPKNFSLT